MLTKVQKWGNSQGIRIPKSLLEDSQLKVGEDVDISAQEGKIIVEAANKIRGKYKIEDLVSQMPDEYKPEAVDWGPPVGREVW